MYLRNFLKISKWSLLLGIVLSHLSLLTDKVNNGGRWVFMPLPTPIKIDWGQIASTTLPVMVCGWYVLLYLVVLSQNVSRHNQRRWTPRALCRLQWHPMAWHYNLRVRHWRMMRKWCGAPWIRSSQWDFHGFPYVWIYFGGHHCLMLKYAFQGLLFLCSSARHHRMCSLDLIRPYLKHPFPGRKGPSFLNSCNFQFHINVGSWLVWGPPLKLI